MDSPSSRYVPYEDSYYNGNKKPPPPPPKPGTQETSSIGGCLESQKASSLSQQEVPFDLTGAVQQVAQTTERVRPQGTFGMPESQDPGEEWLPKILEDKSKQQLAEILETPKLLNALAQSSSTSHPSISAHQSLLQAALKENIALASHLKEVEARLTQQRSSSQAQLLSSHALERQWRQKQTEMDQAIAPFSPPFLYQNLNQAIQEQEQLCNALEANFLDSDGLATEKEAADWVKKFRESRKVYYSRQAKKERWDEGRIGGWR